MTIRNEFKVHRLNEDGIKRAEEIGVLFTNFLDELEKTIGTTGREVAIVRTKMEEAGFFAKKAMAVKVENQVKLT